MNLLVMDTASTLCAACVFDTKAGRELGRAVLDLGKGHAEHLMTVVEDAMREADVGFQELGAIAVSVGPGSFTGVRVGVSAARGFAMALKVPAIGVTSLEAIAAEARERSGARQVMSAIGAGRGEINAAIYDEAGGVIRPPAVMTLADAVASAEQNSLMVAGSAALRIAEAARMKLDTGPELATADIRFYAAIAAVREASAEKPKPLYLRDADAKPQAGFVLARQPK